MKRPFAVLASLVLAAPLALGATAATAASAPEPTEVVGGLITPLKLALDLDGSVYVSQNFAGQITKVDRRGNASTIYTTPTPGNEVGAVSAFAGSVYFTETVSDGPQTPIESYLYKMDRRGTVTQLADIRAFENATNPDAGQTYGIVDLPAGCDAQIPAELASLLLPYPGYADSHPYATLGTPLGTVIADAGSNTLFTVDARGKMRTLAVFPSQPVVLPPAVTALGLPECAVGTTYHAEAVPTDVELGPDGWLYVSLLPGGPEDASLGLRASVVKVHPLSGRIVPVASGLLSATDLAVSPRGDIYVAQLFGSEVAVIKRGTSTPVPFRAATGGAAVEWGLKGVYATVDAFPPQGPTGRVVILPF